MRKRMYAMYVLYSFFIMVSTMLTITHCAIQQKLGLDMCVFDGQPIYSRHAYITVVAVRRIETDELKETRDCRDSLTCGGQSISKRANVGSVTCVGRTRRERNDLIRLLKANSESAFPCTAIYRRGQIGNDIVRDEAMAYTCFIINEDMDHVIDMAVQGRLAL
jgi:hypothetical protein